MDVIGLGCTLLRSSFFEASMGPVGYFGHGLIGTSIGLALLAYGFLYDNKRMKQAGLAVLLSIMVAGTLAHLLKLLFQLPRPKASAGYYGFSSGHASTGFSLAAALGIAFPQLSPFFYLFAVLTGISRLYFRAHFVLDVIGGALIGTVMGIAITKKLIYPLKSQKNGWPTYLGWSITAIVGIAGSVFFIAYEKSTRSHMVSDYDVFENSLTPVIVDFGTPEARKLFRYGWSTDEKWMDGKLSVVWADGRASALSVPFPNSENYRMRLRLFPFAPKGPSCKRVEVTVNSVFVASLYLEQGWHSYEFMVPKTTIKTGKNEIEFLFDYPESPNSRGISTDERLLSVAFETLEILPE